MMLSLEIIPLRLYGAIRFQLRVTLGVNGTDTLIDRNQVIK